MNGEQTPETPGFFNPQQPSPTPVPQPDDYQQSADQPVAREPAESALLTWASSAAHSSQKSVRWYATLILGSLLIAVVLFLITRDVVSSSAIVVAAIIFGSTSIKSPQPVQYLLDESGLTVNNKHYAFEQFRSFSIIDEASSASIVLSPLKRFSPLLSIAYGPQQHQQIVGTLSKHLPLGEYKRDALDALIDRMKF